MAKITPLRESRSLSEYHLPAPLFDHADAVPDLLKPLWVALRHGAVREALFIAHAFNVRMEEDCHQAALFDACAAAEMANGNFEQAKRLAAESLGLVPTQWLAHRIILQILDMQGEHAAALQYCGVLTISGALCPWDEPIEAETLGLGAAALSWRLGDWEGVAVHLARTYPLQMPEHLLEDWFRLALYRRRPEDAAVAIAALSESQSSETLDALLQVLVQQGWAEEALQLYRTAFARDPQNSLFRRRLVALCIKQGDLEQARRLTRAGALDMAA